MSSILANNLKMMDGEGVSECRLCKKSCDFSINIFEPNGTNGLVVWKIIKELLQLDVREEDGLPVTICNACMRKVRDFKYFKTMCINTHMDFIKASVTSRPELPSLRGAFPMSSSEVHPSPVLSASKGKRQASPDSSRGPKPKKVQSGSQVCADVIPHPHQVQRESSRPPTLRMNDTVMDRKLLAEVMVTVSRADRVIPKMGGVGGILMSIGKEGGVSNANISESEMHSTANDSVRTLRRNVRRNIFSSGVEPSNERISEVLSSSFSMSTHPSSVDIVVEDNSEVSHSDCSTVDGVILSTESLPEEERHDSISSGEVNHVCFIGNCRRVFASINGLRCHLSKIHSAVYSSKRVMSSCMVVNGMPKHNRILRNRIFSCNIPGHGRPIGSVCQEGSGLMNKQWGVDIQQCSDCHQKFAVEPKALHPCQNSSVSGKSNKECALSGKAAEKQSPKIQSSPKTSAQKNVDFTGSCGDIGPSARSNKSPTTGRNNKTMELKECGVILHDILRMGNASPSVRPEVNTDINPKSSPTDIRRSPRNVRESMDSSNLVSVGAGPSGSPTTSKKNLEEGFLTDPSLQSTESPKSEKSANCNEIRAFTLRKSKAEEDKSPSSLVIVDNVRKMRNTIKSPKESHNSESKVLNLVEILGNRELKVSLEKLCLSSAECTESKKIKIERRGKDKVQRSSKVKRHWPPSQEPLSIFQMHCRVVFREKNKRPKSMPRSTRDIGKSPKSPRTKTTCRSDSEKSSDVAVEGIEVLDRNKSNRSSTNGEEQTGSCLELPLNVEKELENLCDPCSTDTEKMMSRESSQETLNNPQDAPNRDSPGPQSELLSGTDCSHSGSNSKVMCLKVDIKGISKGTHHLVDLPFSASLPRQDP